MKSPKAPKPTAQQIAVERRQAAALDKEIEEQEERFAALARGKTGVKSLLGGVPRAGAVSARKPSAGKPSKTMLGMNASGFRGPYGGISNASGPSR